MKQAIDPAMQHMSRSTSGQPIHKRHKCLAEKAENLGSTFSVVQSPCNVRDFRIELDMVGGVEGMGSVGEILLKLCHVARVMHDASEKTECVAVSQIRGFNTVQ